jgi:hypothetical protein
MGKHSGKVKQMLTKHKFDMLISVYVFLSLSYVLLYPFIADDGAYLFIRGKAMLHRTGILDTLLTSLQGWTTQGRFFPFSSYALIVMYYLTDNFLYKTVLVLCIVSNVLMFGNFVEKITGSRKVKYILMLLSTLFFQIVSIYASPMIAFHMFMQLMFGLLMLTLIYLHKYLDSQKTRYLVVSIICLFISLLTYEIAFTFIMIVSVYILFFRPAHPRRFILVLFYSIPVLIVGLINMYIKMKYPVVYIGAVPSLDIAKIISTFLKQSVAAVPLSNYLFQKGNGVLSPNLLSIIKNINVQDLLVYRNCSRIIL